jgi:hypothetical protein
MAEERPEISLEMVRQRELVSERATKGQYEAMAVGMRVLRTMEANLAILRDRLRIEEQRCGFRPAGPLSVVEEAQPKAAPSRPR